MALICRTGSVSKTFDSLKACTINRLKHQMNAVSQLVRCDNAGAPPSILSLQRSVHSTGWRPWHSPGAPSKLVAKVSEPGVAHIKLLFTTPREIDRNQELGASRKALRQSGTSLLASCRASSKRRTPSNAAAMSRVILRISAASDMQQIRAESARQRFWGPNPSVLTLTLPTGDAFLH